MYRIRKPGRRAGGLSNIGTHASHFLALVVKVCEPMNTLARSLCSRTRSTLASSTTSVTGENRYDTPQYVTLNQANDQWGNHLWNPYFNVTGELFVGSNNVTTEDGIIIDARDTNTSGNTSVIAADMEDISVGFLGNGSGIARVTYVPLHAGTRYLHGELSLCITTRRRQ